MTPMKALSMLDHVALWLTRGRAALVLVFVTTLILFQAFYRYVHSDQALTWLVELFLMFFVWFVGSFYLFNKIVRTCLWVGSLYLFVVLFYNFCLELRDIPYLGDSLDYLWHVFLGYSLFPIIPLLGVTSLIWVLARRLRIRETSNEGFNKNHPLPSFR